MPCVHDNDNNCTGDEAVYVCELGSVEYYGYTYFYTPVAIIGVILNCFNLRILSGPYFKSCGPTFTFLLAKAVADTLFLVFASPIGVVRCAKQSEDWQLYSRQIYDIYIYTPIGHSFSTASVWLMAIVAMERYLTVAHSTLARKFCTKDYAQWSIFFVYVLAVTINLPYFFYRCVSNDNTRVYTSFAESQGFKVYSWCRTLLIKYIPIILVIIFNMLLLSFVCKSTRKRKSSVYPEQMNQTRQKLQSRITAMMLGVTVTFVLCHFLEPLIHTGIYRSIFGYCSVYTQGFRDFRMFVKFLETTSYATSFIFYYLFNKEFAVKMKEFLKCESPSNRLNTTTAQDNGVVEIAKITAVEKVTSYPTQKNDYLYKEKNDKNSDEAFSEKQEMKSNVHFAGTSSEYSAVHTEG